MISWLKGASSWVTSIWEHKNTKSTIASVTEYSYNTVVYLFEQFGAIPRVLHSTLQKKTNRAVAGHLLRIAAEDLVPLVLVSVTHDYLQTRGQAYLDDDPDNAVLSADFLLQMSLYLLQTAAWAYSVRKKTQLLVRTSIVTLEAPSLLNQMKNTQDMSICLDEKCSSLRFAQGSIRDLGAYWSTEGAIACVRYFPVVGVSLASVLSVYHRGRYVLATALPNVCNRHQIVYMQEHSELALSLGVAQATSAWLIQSLVETLTGIPSVLYSSAIDQLLLIAQMNVATHLTLPIAKNKSTRQLLDPVFYYQKAVGFTLDLLLLGLKIKIPRMLEGSQPGTHMKEFLRQIPESKFLHAAKKLHQTKMARIFLPRLLHSTNAFIHDPIIQYHWPQVQSMLINYLKTIESLREHPAIIASSSMPEVSSALMISLFGTPKYITKFILQLVTDDDVIEWLRATRYAIENCQLEARTPTASFVTSSSSLFQMRAPDRKQAALAIMPPQATVSSCESDLFILPPPEEVIRKRNGERFSLRKEQDMSLSGFLRP